MQEKSENITIYDSLLSLKTSSLNNIAIEHTDSTKSITYENLLLLINKTRQTFSELDFIHKDKVALAIQNGPKMASMFIATASNLIACPLNPSYKESEFIFYFKDLKIRAVIVEKNCPESLKNAANKTNVKLLYLEENSGEIIFDKNSETKKEGAYEKKYSFPKSTDIALILHTSGTTSRPKMVPLTHKNLITSSKNISKTLKLSENDKCLNIMPLFHIHGLVAGLLASLYKGGISIIPPSGFNALSFFKWLDNTKPTWYTAVPTMHQTILARAIRNKNIINTNHLRFIRSSSASLPESVMQELEKTFNTPVIESYGMTEAAHQMTSNPLPPQKRKSGSVGIPAGPVVRIMFGNSILENDKTERKGQIVIKGENVTEGYLNNNKANSENFFKNWFLTGDEGYFDKDGYLIISGRLKEIINRGGEKISPLEVDEILTKHSDVQQVVTFSIPHPKLGEDVAAVVVLNKDIDIKIAEQNLKNYCKDKLADFKIPKKIFFMEEIPKGATGKIQRIGMDKKLGIK